VCEDRCPLDPLPNHDSRGSNVYATNSVSSAKANVSRSRTSACLNSVSRLRVVVSFCSVAIAELWARSVTPIKVDRVTRLRAIRSFPIWCHPYPSGRPHTRYGRPHTRYGRGHTTSGRNHTRYGRGHTRYGRSHTTSGRERRRLRQGFDEGSTGTGGWGPRERARQRAHRIAVPYWRTASSAVTRTKSSVIACATSMRSNGSLCRGP